MNALKDLVCFAKSRGLILLGLGLVAGCTGAPQHDPGTPIPVVDAAPTADLADPVPSCDPIDASAVSLVTATTQVGAAPAATGGGPIADGRYVLVAFTIYAPAVAPDVSGMSGIIEVSAGGRIARYWDAESGVSGERLTYAGTRLTTLRSCPFEDQATLAYSFSAQTLKTYVALGGGRTAESIYVAE